jgi:hypothetical protein
VVGQIVAAILAAIAAVIVLIGQILSKAKEEEAEAGHVETASFG